MGLHYRQIPERVFGEGLWRGLWGSEAACACQAVRGGPVLSGRAQAASQNRAQQPRSVPS